MTQLSTNLLSSLLPAAVLPEEQSVSGSAVPNDGSVFANALVTLLSGETPIQRLAIPAMVKESPAFTLDAPLANSAVANGQLVEDEATDAQANDFPELTVFAGVTPVRESLSLPLPELKLGSSQESNGTLAARIPAAIESSMGFESNRPKSQLLVSGQSTTNHPAVLPVPTNGAPVVDVSDAMPLEDTGDVNVLLKQSKLVSTMTSGNIEVAVEESPAPLKQSKLVSTMTSGNIEVAVEESPAPLKQSKLVSTMTSGNIEVAVEESPAPLKQSKLVSTMTSGNIEVAVEESPAPLNQSKLGSTMTSGNIKVAAEESPAPLKQSKLVSTMTSGNIEVAVEESPAPLKQSKLVSTMTSENSEVTVEDNLAPPQQRATIPELSDPKRSSEVIAKQVNQSHLARTEAETVISQQVVTKSSAASLTQASEQVIEHSPASKDVTEHPMAGKSVTEHPALAKVGKHTTEYLHREASLVGHKQDSAAKPSLPSVNATRVDESVTARITLYEAPPQQDVLESPQVVAKATEEPQKPLRSKRSATAPSSSRPASDTVLKSADAAASSTVVKPVVSPIRAQVTVMHAQDVLVQEPVYEVTVTDASIPTTSTSVDVATPSASSVNMLQTVEAVVDKTAPVESAPGRQFIVEVPKPLRVPGQLRVRIDPPQFGHIRVDLTSTGNGIIGTMRITSEQTREIVERQIGDLHKSLADAGVRVERLEVVGASRTDGKQAFHSNTANQHDGGNPWQRHETSSGFGSDSQSRHTTPEESNVSGSVHSTSNGNESTPLARTAIGQLDLVA